MYYGGFGHDPREYNFDHSVVKHNVQNRTRAANFIWELLMLPLNLVRWALKKMRGTIGRMLSGEH